MPSPFPGMNPYLENPALWSEFHNLLISSISQKLNPILRPKYRVAIEQRVYQTTDGDSLLVGVADVAVQKHQTANNQETENIAVASPPATALTVTIPMPETVKETYLEVRDVATREVVTVIEVLSPKNKRAGDGRQAYNKKRLRVLGSLSNLVEIDLLRNGKPMAILQNDIQSNYRILVSRSDFRPKADLYAFNLQNPIPSFLLPLRDTSEEPIFDLQTILHDVYDRASYDLVIDYTNDPVPALSDTDQHWFDMLLQENALR
ncbi:hypothetical protein NIES4071_63600 [Calothrix sp. NIES-4071]|nr:hypothetical protein NIES4071_63600 [Calothrix sp. NIES-4071]BAZ60663.1 hypothetical protein NIES4105_63550 [Calothrix sp. NIES-4105]